MMTSDELRALLEMTTNYSFDYLQSLTYEELLKIYEVKTNGR
ncbi:hypothetical protein [Neobacillus drentensis]|nr:hypothetical protein [Neobacillus drentensis]